MSLPELSVCMIAYNRSAWMREALDSILEQEGVSFELLVLDNGSTDDTWEVLLEYAAIDQRIRLFRREENLRGDNTPLIEAARGKWIAPFCDDDRMLPGGLARKVQILRDHPQIGFVYSTVHTMDEEGKDQGIARMGRRWECDRIGGAATFEDLITGCFTPYPTCIARADLYKRHHPQSGETGATQAADWHLWLKIVRDTDQAYVAEPTAILRQHGGQDTHSIDLENHVGQIFMIWRWWLECGGARLGWFQWGQMRLNLMAMGAAAWIPDLVELRRELSSPGEANLCLCMIVKNEAHVIERCLDSVIPWIGSWAIVDTGSTDGTQDLIRAKLGHLPGRLIDCPWVDFSTNRNQAIRLSREVSSDYLLFPDADEELEVLELDWLQWLAAPTYTCDVALHQAESQRTLLARSDLDFHYEGVIHEHLEPQVFRPRLDSVRLVSHGDGARSLDPEKYERDLRLLHEEIERHPDDPRSWLYLARTYQCANRWREALEAYERRAFLGTGWDQEIFYSFLMRARLKQALAFPESEVILAYLQAQEICPSRGGETLGYLSAWLRLCGMENVALQFACLAACLPEPSSALFLERDWYRWKALREQLIAATETGNLIAREQALLTLRERGVEVAA